MKKIGIFAGTFDPIHEGHILLARAAIERTGLDKVFFLVEPRPRRKQGVKAFEHRLAMVQLAIKSDRQMGSIRLEQGRFTVHETLPALQARFQDGQLYLLMGDDWAAHLAGWSHVNELAGYVKLIVAVRKRTIAEVKHDLQAVTRIKGLPLEYTLLKKPLSAESSRHIRHLLKKGQLPPTLHPAVYSYIKRHGLYASDDVSS